MRRLLIWTVVGSMVLLAAGRPALAKEGYEDPREGATGVPSSPPGDLRPGQPWNALITFLKDGAIARRSDFAPSVTLTNIDDGQVVRVQAVLARPGVYSARIVLPAPGRWLVAVGNGFDGRVNDLTTFRVDLAPAPAGGRSLSLWGWVLSGLLSLTLVTGALVAAPRIRRRRQAIPS
jgi:hypothetical protein